MTDLEEAIADLAKRIGLLEEANRQFRTGEMSYKDMGPPEVDRTPEAIARNQVEIDELLDEIGRLLN